MEENSPISRNEENEDRNNHLQQQDAIETAVSPDFSGSTQDLVPRTRKLRKSDCSSDWCTTPQVYFLLFTNFVMILMVFILPVICDNRKAKPGDPPKCLIDPFSLLIYSHTLYWFSHLVVDQYLKYHHRRGRLRGYVEFYIQTKNLRRTPFYIISFGNAILLMTVTALHDYCDHNTDASCEDKETKVEFLRGFITLQCMVVGFMWVKYIVAIKKFKKDNKRPDLFRSDFREQVLGLRPQSGDMDQASNNDFVSVFPPPEPRDEVDLLQLQSELLVYLVPAIGQETDVRRQYLSSRAYAPPPRD